MSNRKKNANGYIRSTFHYKGKKYVCYGKDAKEADQKAALKEDALKRGEVGISGKMLVKCWAYEWLEAYKKPKVTKKSFAGYERFINNLIVPEIGNMLIEDVKAIQLQKILNSREGYSKSDITKLRNTIQAMFSRARKDGLIPRDPSEDLEMPKTAQKIKRRSVSDHERKWILTIAETHHAGLWVKTMLFCGLRPGEIMGLTWLDVDIKRKLIYINKAKESGNNNVKAPKTDEGDREVPIPDVLVPYLEKVRHGKNPHDPVFTQKTNDKPHTEASFYKAWHNFLREMDIAMGAVVYRNQIIRSMIASDLCPYCLRHTYCTDLEVAGVPINVAARYMGHSDIRITAKIYTHPTDKVMQETAEKINALHRKIS